MEEEVSRHKSVIYSDAFQALTAAETPVESHVPTASPRLYMLQFPPNSSLDSDPPRVSRR